MQEATSLSITDLRQKMGKQNDDEIINFGKFFMVSESGIDDTNSYVNYSY